MQPLPIPPLHPPARYPATFEDAVGSYATQVLNDGESVGFTVRGVAFAGGFWDGLEPTDPGAAREAGFVFNGDDLCGFRLDYTMPIGVRAADDATLHVALDIGAPPAEGAPPAHVLVQLLLVIGDRRLRSTGTSGWFEQELLELIAQLAPGERLRACIGCAYSDYSPVGQAMFGSMACFRNNKRAYRAVDGKQALFDLWDDNAGLVQETFCCEDWAPRTPGTGYRG
jgi:Family of unknown function (DUF6304)